MASVIHYNNQNLDSMLTALNQLQFYLKELQLQNKNKSKNIQPDLYQIFEDFIN